MKKWPITGTLLYHRNNSDDANRLLSMIQSQSVLWEVEGIEGGDESLSCVVPSSLREREDVWLCLSSVERPIEMLIVPLLLEFSENNILEELKIIRGKITQPWTPLSGYTNYMLSCRKKRQTPRALVLCLKQPLDKKAFNSSVNGNFINNENQEDLLQNTKKLFVVGTGKTRGWREEFLCKILESAKDINHEIALEEFEDQLIGENLSLFESAQRTPEHEIIVPRIVQELGDFMDQETKKFLVSSKNVEAFATKNLPNEFDYSLPGSGVWKAVERELNASIIWHLRRSRNIAADNPWTTSRHCSEEVNIFTNEKRRKVNLNRRDKTDSSKLGSIMLGEIAHILFYGDHNGVKEDFNGLGLSLYLLEFLTNDLPNKIMRVSNFRNRNAHIAAMSKSDYHQLSKLVLDPENELERSLLGKILVLKKNLSISDIDLTIRKGK